MIFVDYLQILTAFCVGVVFFWAFGVAVKHQARKYSNARAGAKGREAKKADENEAFEFMDELADAWEKKPEGHGYKEFLLQDKGFLIILRHGPLIMRNSSKIGKMVMKRLNLGKEDTAGLLDGFIDE